ncbi:Hypothetical predicted protein [Paramuricea clavata]|uniref:Uncharacterized protein n=1 Tax=Paramuricea clavata TaxID=317549 RepID=A0A7D9EJL6_PARCT|nr:Hypothetical predicted protein [Paramuricea clavata]
MVEPIQFPAEIVEHDDQIEQPIQQQDNLKGEAQTLQKALDILTKASVESILHRLLNFMASPLTEFNKYEALEMTEELQNTAHDRNHPKERYYRVVYQTVREKIEVPPLQFHALLLRLLGDKDQERVSEIVSKTFAPWQWEYDVEFDAHVIQTTLPTQAVGWVTSVGEPMVVSGEVAPTTGLDRHVTK